MSADPVPSAAVEQDKQLVVRIPASLLDRIDAYMQRERDRTGYSVSRADAVRRLLGDALDAAGVAAPNGKPSKGGKASRGRGK